MGDLSYQDFQRRFEYDASKVFKRGGMAVIYRAYDKEKRRHVAIKRAEYSDRTRERFSIKSEFKIGTNLNHKNIAQYYECHRLLTDLGTYEFGIMEFIEGGLTLEEFIKQYRPDQETLKEIYKGILEGLHYLHTSRNIVHMDLKPSNILIKYENGEYIPKLIDFGISHKNPHADNITETVVGTKAFMAPEQFYNNKPIVHNTDLWSFGVIVFINQVQRYPFGSKNEGYKTLQIENNILNVKFQASYANVPQPYKKIIKKCLVKDSNKRISSAQDLLKILNQEPGPTTPWWYFAVISACIILVAYISFIGYQIINTRPYVAESCAIGSNESMKACSDQAISAMISSLVEIPDLVNKKEISGQVIVEFNIDSSGSFTEITPLTNIGYGLEESVVQAIEMASSQMNIKPAKKGNKTISARFTYKHQFN